MLQKESVISSYNTDAIPPPPGTNKNKYNKLNEYITAIKGWATYESARYVGKPVIGASKDMLSSYW